MYAIALIFLSLAYGQTQDQKIHLDVEKYQLANGLTVLLYEDHSSPSFSFHQWFRVGSVNEQPGRTGLAHFFEHLMFKGTAKHPPREYEKIVQSNGGIFNAFTTNDYTGYYASMPAGKLESVVELEADRMRNLAFDAKEIQNEREVVKEERRMRFDNDVMGSMQESIFRTVYKVHSYHTMAIGSMKDLNAASIDDLKAFYNTYYSPNNAVIVIVGDFQKSEAKHLIQKYYGSIPSQLIPAETVTPEPEQKSPRKLVIKRPVQNPTVAVTYLTSKSGDSDTYALDLLSNILGEGVSSRLHRKLVYTRQIVSAISSSSWTPKYPGIFQITASVKPGVSTDSVVDAVLAEINAFRNGLVTDLELEKAKNQIMMSFVSGLKTNAGKAHALAINEVLTKDYRNLFSDLDRYQAVTKEQIQQVAKKYLAPQRRSVVEVVAE